MSIYDDTDALVCADYAHNQICPTRAEHTRQGCITGPRDWQVSKAFELLAERPNDAARVRVMFHDLRCMSDCSGDHLKEHAKTQAPVVAAIRRWIKESTA